MAAKRTLTRAAVIAAGRELAETGGVEAVTMRRVAALLGCSPMALYRHVDDRSELLVLVLEDLAEGIDVTVADDVPQEQVVSLFRGLHAYLGAHVWAVDVLREGELFAPRALIFVDAALGALRAAGLDTERAVTAYVNLWNFTVGALCATRPTDPDAVARRRELTGRAPLADLPHVVTAVPLLDGLDPARVHEAGLRALVTGLITA
ncbi:TetR/AcrR family transcriptional regulator [Actinoplanes couchii]|uniref:TetR family transcriptional regulator n=1 Tax=Actinoplanes couchii TaxID=403638 RepID=A0ABQ3XQI1_9ACTN|nr:TetR/AcrR family transcriptional regulator C-terminal domain-containing protein [Actinoplanes couchii]MDR6317437.1 AcrR family transcriptional regulator [Actinoplanes couchii]GID60738.1 TetR family transcriptional regulator [Actinoplanes couchii]